MKLFLLDHFKKLDIAPVPGRFAHRIQVMLGKAKSLDIEGGVVDEMQVDAVGADELAEHALRNGPGIDQNALRNEPEIDEDDFKDDAAENDEYDESIGQYEGDVAEFDVNMGADDFEDDDGPITDDDAPDRA